MNEAEFNSICAELKQVLTDLRATAAKPEELTAALRSVAQLQAAAKHLYFSHGAFKTVITQNNKSTQELTARLQKAEDKLKLLNACRY